MDKGFYVAPDELSIDPSLRLSTEYDEEIDPVTYEVLRHNLWNVNEEHGSTITTVAASPAVFYAQDISPCLLTETGEFVYFGPYIQFFGGMTDLPVKWTLEHRSGNPGIQDGDMFLSNDPLIGTHHQPDVFLLCPVFWQGELFCWAANALHHYDVGGNTPGSFCVDARDIYDEPVPIPPIKVVEGGEVRRDVLDMFLRHSRLPDIVNLDLRAQIAGNNVAKDRVLRLLDRYGPRVVKGVMHKIIGDAEEVFLEKLRRIPDGEWQARGYLEAAHPGDRNIYEARMRLRKEGDELTFDNHGTHEQTGTLSTTYAGWRGAIMSVLNPFFCYDMLYAIGGGLRHLNFDAEPGTLLSVVHPAATSCSAAFGTPMAIDLAHECVMKMLSAAPSLREVVAAPGGHSQTGVITLWGMDQRQKPYGTILLDHMIGSIGAFAWRDGISTGGIYWDPQITAPNAEFNERHYPVLFLYRREAEDNGGAGRFRGGSTIEMGLVPHRTDEVNLVLVGAGLAVPASVGLEGGHPGAPTYYRHVRGSNVKELMAGGRLPQSLDELDGEQESLSPKTSVVQLSDDVFAMGCTGSGGFGDPLDREPGAVALDVREGAISDVGARDIYRVVLRDGEADADATADLRAQERQRRLGLRGSDAPARTAAGAIEAELSGQVLIVADGEGSSYACSSCRAVLSDADESYKHGCIREDLPLSAAGASIGDPSRFIDVALEFRAFYCPSCATQITTEIARCDDPVLEDARIHLDRVEAIR